MVLQQQRHRPARLNALKTTHKDHRGLLGCYWYSCLDRAFQSQKAKREYSTFKGSIPLLFIFLRKPLILSKLPEHALGLEVGGKRKGKCKPHLKSPLSTSTDAKLKPFSLSNQLISEKKGKKGKGSGSFCNPSPGGGKMQGTRKLGEVHIR